MSQCPFGSDAGNTPSDQLRGWGDLTDPDSYLNGVPLDWFTALRREQPVAWQEDPRSGVGFWAISRREQLDFIAKNPALFSSAERTCFYPERSDAEVAMMRTLLINMDPPDHVKYRRIVRNAFTPRQVDSYEPRSRAIARDILDRVAPAGRCEFVKDIAAELPLIAICELMGIPLEDRHQFFQWTNTMIGAEDPELGIDREAAALAHFQVFQYGRKLAELYRQAPQDNIVGALIDARVQDEHLTEDEFCNFFLLLVVAGNETTRTVTSHGMRLLIEHPEQYRRLQADPTLVPHAIEEFLRYTAAVIQFRRTAMHDIELGGAQIRRGDKVILFYPSANHDEAVFKQPELFDVERDRRDDIKNEHRAFGFGEHFCLGAHLARLELRVIFDEIVRRIDNPRFDGELHWLRSNFISGIKTMPIAFDAR
jgi:cholest-4-en-3-one 26-monooxygenase